MILLGLYCGAESSATNAFLFGTELILGVLNDTLDSYLSTNLVLHKNVKNLAYSILALHYRGIDFYRVRIISMYYVQLPIYFLA